MLPSALHNATAPLFSPRRPLPPRCTFATSTTSASSKKDLPAPAKHEVETESLDLVMLEGKVAVVLGATGEVGESAVQQLLDEGAKTVVIVADSEARLDEIKRKFPKEATDSKRLVGVLGSYRSKSDLEDILKRIKQVLGEGVNIDHVVSSLGYTSTTTSTHGGAAHHRLTSGVDQFGLLTNAIRQSMMPSVWAADVFLPVLRDFPDASFTLFNDFYPESLLPDASFSSQMINDAFAEALTSIALERNPKQMIRLRRALRK